MTHSDRDPAADLFAAARDLAAAQAAPPPGLPSLTELQARFPEYALLGLIGRGGMGAVYRAHDPRLGRAVAIKILPPHLADDPDFAARFAQEARTLAGLRHPHILGLHDYGDRDGMPFLVTEFVDGLDLRKLIDTGRLTPEEALRIVPQICDALQHAHEHGVVHRDIKPENVLVDTDGQVKVADFGIARIVDGDAAALCLTGTQQTIGTPHYTAPEALRGGPVDHRADIFALGVLLYELLTGRLPIGRFAPPSQRAGTERRLDAVVARALRGEPSERYQSAAAVRAALGRGPRRRRARTSRVPARARAWKGILAVLAIGISIDLILAGWTAVPSFSPLDAMGILSAAAMLAGGAFASYKGFRLIASIERGNRSTPPALAVLLAWLPPALVSGLVPVIASPAAWRVVIQTVVALGIVGLLIWRIAVLRRAAHAPQRRPRSIGSR